MKVGRRSRFWSRRGTGRMMAAAVVTLTTIGGLAFGSGADRLAALKQPSLEALLSEREAYAGGQHPPPPRRDLLDRYESLRQRRLRVEDELPRAVKPGLWRRPPLDSPPLLIPIKRPARAVDLDPGDPDGVRRGATK